MYSTELSLIFKTFVLAYWQNFTNLARISDSILVGIEILHSQLLTNSHLHFLFTAESATSKVLLPRPKEMTFWQCQVRTLRTLSFHWNNFNSCVRNVLCGVALLCWRVTLRNRWPGLFLQTALHSRRSTSQ